MAASSSMRDRSTISTMRPSSGTRSPGWARRCATRPLIGATSVVSPRLLRASSTAASAACRLAWAPAALLDEVSSAVGEMKPWATSALLLVSWRWAMSSCARAAVACCSAWRRRQSNSVASSWPITWPAFTASPSRTLSVFSSAATLALTKAVFTAFRLPDTSSRRLSVVRSTVSRSCGANSSCGCGALAAVAAVAACVAVRRASHCRPTSTTAASTSSTTNQRNQGFLFFGVSDIRQRRFQGVDRRGARSARPAPGARAGR